MAAVRYANPPKLCALCSTEIGNTFFDFQTSMGPWANGCPDCFEKYDGKLGIGLGQKFVKSTTDGHFYKVDG